MDMDNFRSVLEVTVARVGGKQLSTQQQVGDGSLLNCVKLYTRFMSPTAVSKALYTKNCDKIVYCASQYHFHLQFHTPTKTVS